MKSLLILAIMMISSASYSYVDFNLSYSFSMRKVEGVDESGEVSDENGSAVTTSNGYGVNIAWYIWEYTALELNYSETTEVLRDDREASSGDITIKELESEVKTKVAGVGLRQSFASRKSRIIPSISLGYAKYTTSGVSRYLLDDNGTERKLEIEQDQQEFSSSYASASLKFRLTKFMGLTLGAKTIMPDFDTSQASNNVTYSAGFSWIF